jgi:2-polyprenyl-3-methyl-5-hydroxy-6-metoxy-1,4-benzoquinol methylase
MLTKVTPRDIACTPSGCLRLKEPPYNSAEEIDLCKVRHRAHVDPWWFAPFDIGNPLRHWVHNPQTIVEPYVRPGMTVLDVGCGLGWFSVSMARIVGERGKVIAVDFQRHMLNMLRRRAKRAGVIDRIEMQQCQQDQLGVATQVDFALLFAVLHEVPDRGRLLAEIRRCLKPGSKMLLAEPPVHVTRWKFADETALTEQMGFQLIERPRIRWAHAALYQTAGAG